MIATIYVTRVSDGATVSFKDDTYGYWSSYKDADFVWTEGNYACDCNRELLFRRATGWNEDGIHDGLQCSHGRFRVRIEVEGRGVVYEETP